MELTQQLLGIALLMHRLIDAMNLNFGHLPTSAQ
jgi:hypothetical protein